LESRNAAKLQKPLEDDVALVLHTSGTTGRPKAVSKPTLLAPSKSQN